MNDKSTDQPERIVPDRAGWWLVKLARNLDPEVVRVNLLGADLYVSGWANSRVDERPDIVWIAEIPGPAVLAALAEYGDAHLTMIAVARSGGVYTNGEARRLRLALAALEDAIRAERDAGRDGGA